MNTWRGGLNEKEVKMLTYNEYTHWIDVAEEKVKEISRRIAYRKIELRNEGAEGIEVPAIHYPIFCAETSNTASGSMSGATIKNYNDEKLRELEYLKRKYEEEKQYISENAELPPVGDGE